MKWAAVFLMVIASLPTAAVSASQLQTQRDVPGWPERPYDLFLPSAYGELELVSLIVAMHGGGGNKGAQRKLSCPGGHLDDPGCMNAIGDRAGFAVAYPNGTGARIFRNLRTWNAGGGKDGFQCVSGRACIDKIDDVAYFKAILDDIGSRFRIDTSAVFLTGMSNGAAMAHRLACELPGRVAGIAAVGGGQSKSSQGHAELREPGRHHVEGFAPMFCKKGCAHLDDENVRGLEYAVMRYGHYLAPGGPDFIAQALWRIGREWPGK